MSKINDRDIAELNSFWAYQNTNKLKTFPVNDKNFKQVGGYEDNKNQNINGAADIKVYELLDNYDIPSGEQFIVFQGTDNDETINPNNPLKGKLADDWLQNIKLMNNNNKSTDLIKQNQSFINKYNKKINDAKKIKF